MGDNPRFAMANVRKLLLSGKCKLVPGPITIVFNGYLGTVPQRYSGRFLKLTISSLHVATYAQNK
jgi:hypothetical protein